MVQLTKKRKVRAGRKSRACPELGAYIMYALKRRGLTQRDIAAVIGVTPAMVHQVIWGKRVSKRVRISIANALGLADWTAVALASRRVAA